MLFTGNLLIHSAHPSSFEAAPPRLHLRSPVVHLTLYLCQKESHGFKNTSGTNEGGSRRRISEWNKTCTLSLSLTFPVRHLQLLQQSCWHLRRWQRWLHPPACWKLCWAAPPQSILPHFLQPVAADRRQLPPWLQKLGPKLLPLEDE